MQLSLEKIKGFQENLEESKTLLDWNHRVMDFVIDYGISRGEALKLARTKFEKADINIYAEEK